MRVRRVHVHCSGAALLLSAGTPHPCSAHVCDPVHPRSSEGHHHPPPSLPPTAELYAVVTHKGRSADSGHYMAWVRQAAGSKAWLVYDDDAVSETDSEYVTMTLKGGGDDHSALRGRARGGWRVSWVFECRAAARLTPPFRTAVPPPLPPKCSGVHALLQGEGVGCLKECGAP